MITGGDLRQSRLDVGYKTFTISPCGLTGPDNIIEQIVDNIYKESA